MKTHESHRFLQMGRKASKRINNCICQGFFIAVVSVLVYAPLAVSIPRPIKPFTYDFIERELAEGSSNYVEFKQLSDTPVVYRVWGVWNFAYPVKEVAAVTLDFLRYNKIFQYVYRCDRISQPSSLVSPLGTWYVEGRVARARVWCIGNIDTLRWSDSTYLRLIASQNQNKHLESRWSYRPSGWLNYRTLGIRLAAFVVANGPDSCRVGIVVQGWVHKAMPEWLVRTATKIVFPQLLQDIDAEVKKRIQLKKPKEAPWYNQWFRGLKKML